MIFPLVYELGKMVVMELNFPNLPDEKIAVGQWVVLWEEVPVRKIGNNIYKVYPEYLLDNNRINKDDCMPLVSQ